MSACELLVLTIKIQSQLEFSDLTKFNSVSDVLFFLVVRKTSTKVDFHHLMFLYCFLSRRPLIDHHLLPITISGAVVDLFSLIVV